MTKHLFSFGFFSLFFYFCSCNSSIARQNQAGALPEVKSIFINGDSIHYIETGKGTPVVFVHGTIGDYRSWSAQIDTFAENHRVISYSRRFAYPNKQTINDTADYSVMPHAKDLAAFIKALKLEPVHLVGHSYGAFISLLIAINHPELVRSLTLAEPPVMSLLQQLPAGDTIMKNFIKRAIIPTEEAFKENNDKKAVTVFVAGVIGDSLFFSKIPQQGQDLIMNNTLELRGIALTKDFSPPITCDDLKKIKIPVLLLEGDRSPLLFTSIISELDRCLERRERVAVPNSSHGLQLENPVEFNKIVLAFINKQ